PVCRNRRRRPEKQRGGGRRRRHESDTKKALGRMHFDRTPGFPRIFQLYRDQPNDHATVISSLTCLNWMLTPIRADKALRGFGNGAKARLKSGLKQNGPCVRLLGRRCPDRGRGQRFGWY